MFGDGLLGECYLRFLSMLHIVYFQTRLCVNRQQQHQRPRNPNRFAAQEIRSFSSTTPSSLTAQRLRSNATRSCSGFLAFLAPQPRPPKSRSSRRRPNSVNRVVKFDMMHRLYNISLYLVRKMYCRMWHRQQEEPHRGRPGDAGQPIPVDGAAAILRSLLLRRNADQRSLCADGGTLCERFQPGSHIGAFDRARSVDRSGAAEYYEKGATHRAPRRLQFDHVQQ